MSEIKGTAVVLQGKVALETGASRGIGRATMGSRAAGSGPRWRAAIRRKRQQSRGAKNCLRVLQSRYARQRRKDLVRVTGLRAGDGRGDEYVSAYRACRVDRGVRTGGFLTHGTRTADDRH